MGSTSPAEPSVDPPSSWSPSKGQIELIRRRVTKDGRVKLKLELLGVAVDKCGICLSQFKEGEAGVLLRCQHPLVLMFLSAFHVV
jgi:hypothetical protein